MDGVGGRFPLLVGFRLVSCAFASFIVFPAQETLRSPEEKGDVYSDRVFADSVFHFPVVNALTSAPQSLRAQRLKNSISIEKSISLENFNPDLQNSPQKIGVCWVARLKFSISLEDFNPGGRS